MGTHNPRPFAVVTGGSSGIGLELARVMLQNNFDVLIAGDVNVGAALENLSASGGGTAYGVTVDLATDEGIEQLCNEIRTYARPVEALALNAGVGVNGEFLSTALDAEIRMIRLNIIAVVKLAKELLPDMVARGRGRVLITSSIAATMPAPYLAVYGATKAFDLGFAEALRDELRESGVTVTAVQPGPTDTAFFTRAHMEDTKVGRDPKDDPAVVAKQAFDAMMKGTDKIYAGSLKTRLQGAASELLPETVKAAQHRKLSQPDHVKKH